MTKTFEISDLEQDIRLDLLLVDLLGMSRSQVQKLIKDELVRVDDIVVKASYKVKNDQEISVTLVAEEEVNLTPYHYPLAVIFEDDDLLIINKDAGLVVHPSYGHKDDTLVNALVARNNELSDLGGSFRPGIVHRLDKDTSGLLIVCKNNEIHQLISEMLKNHEVVRKYYALAVGTFKEEAGVIKTYLTRSDLNYQKMAVSSSEGKLAITHFKVLERFPRHTFLEAELETGRTHQIRVHFEYLDAPLEGDPLYGRNNTKQYQGGQLLHAHELSFIHPKTNEKLTFNAPLPAHFADVLLKLRTNP